MKKSQVLPSPDSYDVVIAVGETGSSIYPALAVAREFKRQFPALALTFLGPPTQLLSRIESREGFPVYTYSMPDTGCRRISLKILCHVPAMIYRLRRRLKIWRPRLVLGTSGVLAASTLYAAYLSTIPTLIVEVNRQPGLANQLMGRSVNCIAVGFRETAAAFPQYNTIYTGIPVRKEFEVIGKTSPPDKGEKYNILVISGSRGNHAINQAVIDALDDLLSFRDRFAFTHQTGSVDYASVQQNYAEKGFRAEVLEYIEDMPRMYAKAHLIICQAGGSTIAELQASHRPAIVIPALDAHKQQTPNALGIKESWLAEVIPEIRLCGRNLANTLQTLGKHPKMMSKIWANPVEYEQKTAAERLVDLCLQLTNRAIARSPEDSYDRT